MTEKETMEYMESLQQLGSHLGLESTRELCQRLGNPQDDLKFIHVAGTNGKGSILAMISEALSENGYRVGRYISPTISNYRERFQVNGRMIGAKALAKYVTLVKDACDQMVAEGLEHPTPFEFETALSFLYFKDKKCDLVLLETGMGGETDATNVVRTTILAVFATISMDHMQFLGDSLEKIASVKAGIIKECCQVISSLQDDRVKEVLVKKAEAMKAPFLMTGRAVFKRSAADGMTFDYQNYKGMKLSLRGSYQLENAATALEALEALKNQGYTIKEEKIRIAFKKLVWPGRFEQIGKKPPFYIDGAHNEDAAKRLAQTLELYFTNKKIIYIMGILKDKEYDKIIAVTCPLAKAVVTVKTPDNPRAMDACGLAARVKLVHPNVTAADSLQEAVEMANLMADSDTVIVAFGSLSYLGELTRIVQNKEWTRGDSHGK